MIQKYGAFWPDSATPMEIERACIRKGGKWISRDTECGAGLFQHYMALEKLLWPWKDWHRWNHLMLEELVNNRGTVFLGPASSAKTHEVSAFILADYFTWPECTTSLVSSTNLKMLELRIWGEIKKLYADAKARFPKLSGHLNDSKQRITTATRSGVAKDFRNGIQGIACNKGGTYVGLSNYAGIKNTRVRVAGDECFVAGTLVDTPNGPIPIDRIQPGDVVISAIGPQTIRGVFKKTTDTLFRLKTKGLKEFICTGNHPFLTQKGFIEACKLDQSHYLLSAYEGMQVLRGDVRAIREYQNVRQLSHASMPVVQNQLHGIEFNATVLQSILFEQMEDVSAWIQGSGSLSNREDKDVGGEVEVARGKPGAITVCGSSTQGFESGTKLGAYFKTDEDDEVYWAPSENTGRKRNRSYESGIHHFRMHSGFGLESPNQDRTARWIGFSDMLQGGLRVPFFEVGDRSRRGQPWDVFSDRSGQEEDEIFGGDWVDSCEILEPEDFERYRTSSDGVEVFTLQIAGHHTYSVNGLLTKNCQFMPPSFLEAFNNLSKTPRDFKAIGMGNPKDLMDGLGKMAEPENGWETLDRSEKTKTWNCRMPGFRCVQLVGTDSPNYDHPRNRFPYLIKPHQIDEDRKYYGPNSLQFAMMDLGMMPLTGASNRVITEAICRQNHAMDLAIFDGKVTKILGLDAAYGRVGGDRCVGIELWFGKSVKGEEIVAQNGLPWIIPVSYKSSDTPENQIVKYLRKECTDRGIAPEHIFYDSTGRGSLGTSFGRLWSTNVNPIEFGGNASDRPVSAVDSRPCNKVYGKFVTELWYQVRIAVESGQIRGMTMEVVEEGSMREFMMIDGKKVDVEPKSVTKLRMGKSPDLFDGWVCAFEGARRLGFVIASKVISVRTGPTIWDIEAKKTREMYHRRRLTYGAH